MRRKILIILFSLVLSTGLSADSSCILDNFSSDYEASQLSLSYAVGKYISNDKNYAEIELFSPVLQSDYWLSFIDLYGYRFDNGKWAASLGCGIRKNLSEYTILGLNAYYDYRRCFFSQHSFHQVGIGGEWLSNCLEIRVNGYLPLSKKSYDGRLYTFDQLGDDFFATRKAIEYTYSGFDTEIGTSLLNYCDFNIYAGIGPYYFYHSHSEYFWGGLGRLEINWKSILSLELKASYDHTYSTKIQGIIQLSIPLDLFCSSRCQTTCNNLLRKPVRRNGLILTDHCCDWNWNWDDSN